MSAPVKHTCPDIDKAIKLVNEAIKTSDTARKYLGRESEADDYLYDISSGLSDVEDILEGLRRDNDALRTWGHEQEDEVQRLNDRVEELEKQIEDAKQSPE